MAHIKENNRKGRIRWRRWKIWRIYYKIELATFKKDVLQTNENNITLFKKYFFVNRKTSKLCDLLLRYSTLSEEVVTISDIKLGEGTFGVV